MSDGTRIGIYGTSGYGKSTLMNMLLRPVKHLIVFDYMVTRRETAAREGLVEVTSLAEVRDIIADNYGPGFRIWYRPPIDAQIEKLHKLSKFLIQMQDNRYADRKPLAPITFAIDELRRAFPVTALPTDQRGFYDMCCAGRHYRFNIVGASQRPAQVNTEFRGNLEVQYYFHLTANVDLDAVQKSSNAEVRDWVFQLQHFHYIRQAGGHYTTGQTEI